MRQECELSVITVNYNGLEYTCAMIDTFPFREGRELIVVDNGSRTDEAAIIAGRYPHVKTIRSEENLGFAGGNNLGIKHARGKYLYFVNNDTEFLGDDGIGSLMARLQSSPSIGMVCPKIRFAWDDKPVQFAGYTPLSPITLRNSAIGFMQPDRGQYDTPHPTPYAHGAAMMVSREAMEHAGLMPECYFLYYEELDWSLMFTRAGYTIWYEPAGTIYHKESRTTGQDSPLRTYYITRNRLLFAHRNQPWPRRWLTYAYLTLLVSPRDLLVYAVRRRFDLAGAVLKGLLHFVKRHQGR